MTNNPYQSPLAQTHDAPDVETSQFRTVLMTACKYSFWLGIGAGFVGLFRLAAPGGSIGWHLATAALLAAGVFAPRRIYRGLAIVGCAFFLIVAIRDHQQGIEFRQQLRRLYESRTKEYERTEAEKELSPRRDGAEEAVR